MDETEAEVEVEAEAGVDADVAEEVEARLGRTMTGMRARMLDGKM